jgi:hypothetical protein
LGPVVLLAGKAVLAGCFVALISQLSTALRPKMFAGLFAAAPSVAAASLLLNGLQKPAEIAPAAQGMIAGSCGMIACCLAAMAVVPRLHALLASGAGWIAWAAGAAAAYVGLWR